jgi:tetratricopeptide (TPR) repeat protein
MTTDFYHFANAAIRLGLDQHITNEELKHVISNVKSEPVALRGHRWIGALYDETTDDEEENYEDRCNALALIDLDDFFSSHLERLALVLLQEGPEAYEMRQLDRALQCFRNALRIASHLNDREKVAVCLFEIGFVMHTMGNPQFAQSHYDDAIKAFSETKGVASSVVAQYIFHAGRFYELERNFPKARECFQNALRKFEQSRDTEGIRACHEKLGSKPT